MKRTSVFNILTSQLIVLSLCIARIGYAQVDPNAVPHVEGIKLGLEVETTIESFQNIVEFFDMDHLQQTFGDPDASPAWEDLSASEKAKKVIRLSDSRTTKTSHFTDLKLKADAPAEIHDLFSRFIWSKDANNILEFRHKSPTTSTQEFLKDLEVLARILKIQDHIFDPPSVEWEQTKSIKRIFSMHYHLSIEGKDYSRGVAQRLNAVYFLERVNLGIFADFDKRKSPYAASFYRSDVETKGLIRLFEHNRIESRRHSVPFRVEFLRNIEVLSMEEPEAIATLDSMIDELINDQTLKDIWDRDPDFMVDLLDYSPKPRSFLFDKLDDPSNRPKVTRVLENYSSGNHVIYSGNSNLEKLPLLQPREFVFFSEDEINAILKDSSQQEDRRKAI